MTCFNLICKEFFLPINRPKINVIPVCVKSTHGEKISVTFIVVCCQDKIVAITLHMTARRLMLHLNFLFKRVRPVEGYLS